MLRLIRKTAALARMSNTEIQHQRYRACRICQISYQFDVTTILTPAFNHLLCLGFVSCAKKVSKLINRPVVSLVGTRMDGTSTEMITQCIYLKLSATANRKRLLRNHWDLSAHWRKNVCQRLAGQDSSLRWGLIWHSRHWFLRRGPARLQSPRHWSLSGRIRPPPNVTTLASSEMTRQNLPSYRDHTPPHVSVIHPVPYRYQHILFSPTWPINGFTTLVSSEMTSLASSEMTSSCLHTFRQPTTGVARSSWHLDRHTPSPSPPAVVCWSLRREPDMMGLLRSDLENSCGPF